ncbi:endoplasmic reticulum metallopeptidase 1-like [Adelges cooleyi]|uniref:endoplasmic reticulum metallopeptidase 1-like n=1 Tax=Adelges cooleyi TaxID=133065 RepID=UPI00217FF02B|nr:endoplasmic reticulum metallopeptidase 1-like [Adelges cooleyi]
MELRRRGNRYDNSQPMETFQILQNPEDIENETSKNQKYFSTLNTTLTALCILILLNAFVYYMDNRLPEVENLNSASGFVVKRAMATLSKLSDIGPRPVGSFENENLAFNALQKEIESIMLDQGNVNNIDILNQQVSGSLMLNFRNIKFTFDYKNLQNIVVKLNPKNYIEEALLLNCHFDSVPAGPGISDNGVHCAVMMELLRVLAKCNDLRRPIIFLFNGGEEIILQASHGFITQHPWSKYIKYFINLDSCGAGGKEIMFQTTKSNSYLVDLYAHSVPHPHGQVIGEEIFQSGIIPSDTDFRIFRDFGNLSGLDLAHYRNGYVYHTKYDDLNQIEPAVLQHTGNNLLALSKMFSSHNVTTKSKTKYVFFDVLGVYMFSYTELSGVLYNFTVALLSLFSIFLSLGQITIGMNRKKYSLHFLTIIAGTFYTFLLSIVSSVLVAYILDVLGYSMSWYNNKINLIVYFAISTLTILLFTLLYPRNKTRTRTDWTLSLFNGNQLFWTIMLFITTMMGLRSSFLFMIIVLFPSVTNCILGMLRIQKKPHLWITIYVVSLLIPITFIFYLTQTFLSLFIPITGRFGSNFNPDYIIGSLISMSTFATVGYMSPVIMMVKKPSMIIYGLFGLFLLSIITIVSPFGFPYSDGIILPKNERFDIIHVQQTFYNFEKEVRFNNSGFLIVNWDRNAPFTVSKYVPKMKEAINIDCSKELLCGLPLTPTPQPSNSWIPSAPSMSVLKSNTAILLSNESTHSRRIEFNVNGPERINVYISPYPGVNLTAWSFTDQPEVTTQWENNDVYIVRHASGTKDEEYRFWLEVESQYGFNEATLNITVSCDWVIHKNMILNNEFEEFINAFPVWAHVNYAMAKVDAFVY